MTMASLVSPGPALLAILALTGLVAVAQGATTVTYLSPNRGSTSGATRITIGGSEFAADPFAYGEGNEDKGNKVFLTNSTATIECDVLAYWSNTEKIVCDTRAATTGEYSLLIFVDGNEISSVGGSYCRHRRSCIFYYWDSRTPYVQTVTPQSGTPKSRVNIYGKLFTDFYAASQSANTDVEDLEDDPVLIQRVFWGDYFCDIINPETDEPYHLELGNDGASRYGNMEVVPQGTFVESQKLVFLISGEYGRSKAHTGSVRMSGQNKLYHYQAHAEITSIEPSTGSLEGGTLLTINGNYFDAYSETTVLVAGVPCDIQNISDTEILCITNKAPDATYNIYPGSRGMLFERWSDSSSLDTAGFDVDSDDFVEQRVQLEAFSPVNLAGHFYGRLRGYFVPPRDGEYSFRIRGDDVTELYFSDNGDETNMTKIAYAVGYTSNWFKEETQKSEKMSLQSGVAYYLEARYKEYGGGDHVMVGVDFYDVDIAPGIMDGTYNEEQKIRVASNVQQERQVIEVIDTYETQVIQVNYLGCNDTEFEMEDCDPLEYFYITYDGQTTAEITLLATAELVEEELNNATILPENVTASVSLEIIDGSNYTYTVTFNTVEDLELMIVQTNDPFLVDLNVTEAFAGKPAENTNFKFDFGGVQSSRLSFTRSADQIKDALLDMLSVDCRRNGNANPVLLQEFEGEQLGGESGQRVVDAEPLCGRVSLKNPTWIYKDGETENSDGSVNPFRVDFTNMLCFGFKGKISSDIHLTLRYIDHDFSQVSNGDWYTSPELAAYSGEATSWQQECINLNEMVQNQGWIKDDVYGGTGMFITKIEFPTPDANNPTYIDNIFIGGEQNSYTRRSMAARPNDVIVTDFQVNKTTLGFDITMWAANCGHDIPLLAFEESDVVSKSAELDSNMAVYSSSSFSDGTWVRVTREAEATVPVSGTFILENDGRQVELSTTASAAQVKDALESFLDTGIVVVHKSADCYSSEYDVEWISKGGSQPLLQINGTGVDGTDVVAEVVRVVEGRLFMAPIPGEFLRLPHNTSQVEVSVNHIPSTCAVNSTCGFAYDAAATPEVDSVTPGSGSQFDGTSITISGSGFSTDATENNVTIGGVPCDVTSASDTELECDVGPGPAGNYSVIVQVDGKGSAAYPNGAMGFEYDSDVLGVDPVNGSTAGGTQITVTGYGFPCGDGANDRVMVSVGSKRCKIISACYDEITCKITLDSSSRRRRSVETADIVVTIDGAVAAAAEDLFTFDSSLAASISSFSPANSSVLGGGNLTISGSGFDSTGAAVNIGDEECQVVSQTNTEIICELSASTPGAYDLEVTVLNKGFADASSIDQFEYVLQVTSMTPDVGSLEGGTKVTITGAGFGDDPSEISIEFSDKITCDVESITDTQIECVIEVESTVVTVDNLGRHESWGAGYKWNPQLAEIRVGDIIHWQWTVPTYVNGMSYTVQQTANADATSYDGSGFYAGSMSTQGSYAYKFTAPGTYYYSSGAVNGGDLIMKGVINVGPQESDAKELMLFVGDYEAAYVTDSGVSLSSSGGCSPSTDSHDECTSSQPTSDDASTFSFAFWDCRTPIITNISPNTGAPNTIITLTGYGFGTETCQNEILINDYNCVPQSANATHIECEIDRNGTFPVGSYYSVFLNVLGKGSAVNSVTSPIGRVFKMIPAITGLSGDGSTEGGTRLVISGDGFSAATPSDIDVTIGGAECEVESVEYTEVTCVTGKPDSAGTYQPVITINGAEATCQGDCDFNYASASTPQVTDVSPTAVSGASTTIAISGSGFSNDSSDVTVTVGGVDCDVTSASEDAIECDVSYVPVGNAAFVINIAGSGNSAFDDSSHATLWSNEVIDSIDPASGSLEGGQEITIVGSGFRDGDTTVDIGGSDCVIESITLSEIVCISSSHSADTVDLIVTSGGQDYPSQSYDYASSDTPTVSSISPASGVSGDSITISGSGFSSTSSENIVTVNGVECDITSAGASSIDCDVGVHSAGTYVLQVHVQDKGYATSTSEFEYSLAISGTSATQGSFGGGPAVEIQGAGFGSEDDTTVTVCGNVCEILNITIELIECDVPANSGEGSTEDCDIVVTLDSGASATESNGWQYRDDLTPVIDSIDPPRGGTGGGTTLTITGSDFASSGNEVFIAGTECVVSSESSTEIQCRTGAHSPSVQDTVRVNVPNKGVARRENANYYYVDVWSSRYTWGGLEPPIAGDFVVIPAGQTLLLDTSTPILKMVLIQGGSLIFDEVDLTLNSEYILIVDDGVLQVGTEAEPFQHQATIMMHGNTRSKELPFYGAKTLAVRHGTLDLHGKVVPVTWTYLAETIVAGDTQMTLMRSVTWEIGDQIVIAATGHRHAQRENEELTITAVSDDGFTLTFEPAVEYEHISVEQTIDGVYLETRAEVGLLTRNVVVRGSVHSEWTETIEACDAEFDTNQFATQTCFRGKFGEETASDQYGSAIMLFAKEPDKHLSTGRLSYIEVTHAGQAFRLGRYAIHFHLNGNITGNYVRGCAIHHTFNRAVTIHAVHYLLVEYNVAYNIMGHAFFTEDGIETKNIIQYNLAIFVRSSSSLLNVDVTPAAYWVTNADNILRHNNAAGGSHFGFWYRAPTHPEGPSFTTSICPRNVPVLEFYNNTVHTLGWYGIWIFPVYYPKEGGACGASTSAPSEYYNLTAWHVERGAEAVEVGNVRFINFLISDATASGVEYQTSNDAWGGPMVKDSVIIAHSDISHGGCTEAGIQLPKSKYLTVDNVKFINFDQDNCACIRACGHCKPDQGGFESRFQNIEFSNSPTKTRWKWEHECWLEDLDGTLSGEGAGYSVLPYNPNLPPDHCTRLDSAYGTSGRPGAICDDTISFHRYAFNNVAPSSLLYKRTVFVNEHGVSFINYHKKRLTHAPGWMITLIDGDNYRFFFENRDHLTNISYAGSFYDFSDGDFVLMNHNFTQRPDAFALTGAIRNGSKEFLTYENNNNADWHFDNDTRVFTYIISGKGQSNDVTRNVDLDVFRCYYKDCIPPVPEAPPELPNITSEATRPDDVLLWSAAESWADQPEGWGSNTGGGSYSGALPQEGEDVMILPGTYVVADTDLPVMKRLFIYGALELDDTRDYNLTATYILIQGGHLIIGRKTQPFTHNVHIVLEGNHFTPDIPLPNGPNLGSKALGSFGGLDLHGKNHSVYWTHLASGVSAGDNTISVMEDTDWEEGDEIMVTATSYEPWHTETFKIASVTDARTFVLNATFEHGHSSGENTVTDGDVTWTYGLKAEVGLLTRNIKIEGADYANLHEESFGARVIVGRFFQDGEMYQGWARISNVEFYHTGQEGWTDFYDPRYSLAFLDTGPSTEAQPSYVTGCSFHSGFSPAIGVFGAMGVNVQDNIIHHTVGSGIIDYGIGNSFIHNLLAITINPGTYQDRVEPENLEMFGAIHVRTATDPILINNTVAGSEKFGFAIKGEVCDGETSWYGNTVHSTWMGVSLYPANLPGCSKVSKFEIYKCKNYGIYAQISSSLLVTDVKMADNNVAVFALIKGPAALSHQTSDKFVRVQNSLIVAISPQYDCGGDDDIKPEAASISKNHPSKSKSVGIVWPSFPSGGNGAPFKPYDKVNSYPAISGVTYVDNVMFANFESSCGKSPKVIRTNPSSIDMMHPIHLSNIQLVDVDNDFLVFLNRPPLGAVNPSDCVDMDCDGAKKAMIRDLDGSFLGSVGTVIPEAEFEWDGDPRRGLGDYRIPPVMMTRLDGSRIPYADKLPNKGIFRGHNDECTWKSAWTAYECHGIDHMNMVVESLDADTQVRRVSPVGLYSDTYVDLINGPQDNGWCHGYTCQERISTFYTVVATGKSYELVFSGTNPQSLRYHLLNADDTQKVVVGTWYANPQRLDVYVNGIYIMPNNGAIEDGEFVWKNDLAADDYKPLPSSDVYGENFFHRDEATLYINIKGSYPVTVKTTPVVMVTFGVPAITVDDFFEENLINNLVQFLDIEPAQIRIVEIIAEDSKRRRRAAGEIEVVFEIGDPPASTIEVEETSTGTPGPTTEAPPTTAGSGSSSTLDFTALTDIQSTLANEMQSGALGDSLDIAITSMAMTEPAEEPVDPTGGVAATNTTGGSANATGETFAEKQAAEEAAEEESNAVVSVVYRIPTQLIMYTQPSQAVEGAAFTIQPKIKVVDALGILVDQLGTKTHPWQLTTTIRTGSGSLLENTTQPFIGGWVNFTSLAIDTVNSGFVLDFNITFPNTSSLAVSSQAFEVTDRQYYAEVAVGPDAVDINETFEIEVDIKDEISQMTVANLADKQYVWHAVASISEQSYYDGQLVGDVDVTFDLATARAQFTNLSINDAGHQYILKVQVSTVPSSSYDFSVELDPFDVEDPGATVHTGDASTLTIRFDASYGNIVSGKENLFIINFMNKVAPMYPDVTITNVQVSEGSIVVTFDIQGDVEGAEELIYNDLQEGNVVVNFDGTMLTASTVLLVDGEEVTDGNGDTDKAGSEFPILIVIIAVVVVALIAVIIVILVCMFMKKKDKVAHFEGESMPLHTQDSKESTAFINRICTPDVIINDGRSSSEGSEPELQHLNEDVNTTRSVDVSMRSKCSTPNSPRRSPEIQVVTALPPGFSDGQEEKILEDRQRMYLMAKNTDGTFLKLGTIAANLVGTMHQLRQDIMNILSDDLKGKKFVMMKETLKDIEGSREKKLSVSEVFTSDCVLIRFVNETDESKMCVCGVAGQFNCSLCHKQAYCSPQCQSKDWPRHTVVCSSWNAQEQNL